MKNNTLKSGISRVCLISFILLCSMFAIQNAFSGTHWDKNFMTVKYKLKKKNIIEFKFLFYDNTPNHLTDAFLERCIFEYSVDDLKYNPLVRVSTKSQLDDDDFEIRFWGKKHNQKIRIFDDYKANGRRYWTEADDADDQMHAWVKPVKGESKVNGKPVQTLRCYITFQWELPVTPKSIKFIRIRGYWKVLGVKLPDKINETYKLNKVKKYSIVEKNTPLELNSEISNDVTVIGGTDAITVTGAKPGVNIKVYNASGLLLKSVVANAVVVNIKLPKNQVYTVKVGERKLQSIVL